MATTQPGGSCAHQAEEGVAAQRPAATTRPCSIDRMDLDHALGQIDPDANDFPGNTSLV